jgi:pimeloyl-ACP methyl ester carboxylesterase
MNLFYRKFGQGPVLIILHGLYGSSDNWVSIGKVLSEHFEVFLIDLRNHGNSFHSNEHNYHLLKNDLYEFMLSNQIEKAIIIGHSMGGKAAMFFAVDYPEKVQSLIIIDISPRSYKSLIKPESQITDHMNIISSMLSVDFTKIKSREDVDEILSKTIKSVRIRRFLLKNVHRRKDGSFEWKLNLHALHNHLPEIMDGLDPKKFLNGNGITGFPVLFIKGEKSNYIMEEDLQIIKTIFPAADLVSIPDSGHWLHAEKPDLLLKTLRYFILGN